MNYLKLNIGGKERGADLGLLFLENLQREENKNIQEILLELEKRNVFYAPRILYYALLTYCEDNNLEIDFKKSDVYRWVEEDGVLKEEGAILTFIKNFISSVSKIFPPENTSIEEGKKMLPKKGSTPTSGSKK